jgi:hypothetical protein
MDEYCIFPIVVLVLFPGGAGVEVTKDAGGVSRYKTVG